MPKTKGPGKTGRMTPLGSVCLSPISCLCLSLFVNNFAANKQGTSVIDLSEYKSHQKSKSRKVQDNSKNNQV